MGLGVLGRVAPFGSSHVSLTGAVSSWEESWWKAAWGIRKRLEWLIENNWNTDLSQLLSFEERTLWLQLEEMYFPVWLSSVLYDRSHKLCFSVVCYCLTPRDEWTSPQKIIFSSLLVILLSLESSWGHPGNDTVIDSFLCTACACSVLEVYWVSLWIEWCKVPQMSKKYGWGRGRAKRKLALARTETWGCEGNWLASLRMKDRPSACIS